MNLIGMSENALKTKLQVVFQKLRRIDASRNTDQYVTLVIMCAFSAYVFLMLRRTFHYYDHHGILTFDLAIFDQAEWLIVHGKNPFVTIRGSHILGDHFSVILYLISPLYFCFPSGKTLLFIQTISLAVGVLPIYLLARLELNSRIIATLFSISYLIYPPLIGENIREFHPDTLAVTPLLCSFYCLRTKKWKLFFLMLLLAGFCKESVGYVIVMYSCYAVSQNKKMGIATLLFGACMVFISSKCVQFFANGLESPYPAKYYRYTHSTHGVSLYLLYHLNRLWDDFNRPEVWRYVGRLILPLLAFPLLAPEVLLIGLPALLMFVLPPSMILDQYQSTHHYAAFVTPFVYCSAIMGFKKALTWKCKKAVSVLALLLPFVMIFHLWKMTYIDIQTISDSNVSIIDATQINRLLRSNIPDNASVSVHHGLSYLLDQRSEIYTFPNPFYKACWGNKVQSLRQQVGIDFPALDYGAIRNNVRSKPVDYVVFGGAQENWPFGDERYNEIVALILNSRNYGIICCEKKLIIVKAGADRQLGLKLLERSVKKIALTDDDVYKAFIYWQKSQ